MPPKTAATPTPHMGRKIERIRTIKGIKQDVLARQLGIDQSALSRIESSEQIDDDKLQKIADALEMTVEAIKNFNEEGVINYIQNNYEGATGSLVGHQNHSEGDHSSNGDSCTNTFNPLEKFIEAIEENKKLYQALLDEKESKIKMLEELLRGK